MEHNNKELKSFFTENKERYIFFFDLAQEELPLKVQANMQARTSLEEGLLIAIEAANQQLASRGLSLQKDISLYKARLAGKNFKPKTDLPALSLYQKICDLKVSEMAVQILNKEKAILKTQKVAQNSPDNKVPPEQNSKSKDKEEKELASEMAKVEVTEKVGDVEGKSS